MPLAGGERFTIHNRIITEEYNKTNTYLITFISRPKNLGTEGFLQTQLALYDYI